MKRDKRTSSMRHFRLRSRLAIVVGFFFVLSGCMVGPKYQPPPAQAPPDFKELPATTSPKPSPSPPGETPDPTLGGLGNWTVAQPRDAKIRGKWWEMYEDPELNALEEQLNIDNQNIRQFFENFMAARAVVREARSQLFPIVTAGLSYTRSRSASNILSAGAGGVATGATGVTTGVGTSGTGGSNQFIDLPFNISWEPDLWGRIRSTLHAAQYSAELSGADLENERLTEQASLATFFFEIRGQDALLEILGSTVTAYGEALNLTQSQFKTGLTDQLAVVQAENTLQSAQSQQTNLGVARAQFEHAIAVLVGKAASEFSIPGKPMLRTPPPIPVGLPSQLLERRPDIAAAERAMAAANAQTGVAYAAFFPSLNLSASGGSESSSWKRFLNWPSRFWSVGPSISETVFDAGLRRATVNQFIAAYNANLAAYR
jgi:NodT family efflux transporter outer membrane factor (OMF) lipoprotein